MIIWLLACNDDKPVGEPPVPSPPASFARLTGQPADALGNLLDAGVWQGESEESLLIAAYLGNRVCVLVGGLPTGDVLIDDLPVSCFVGEEDSDYAGYGAAGVGDLTGDGAEEILVGSIGNAEAGANAGKVYLIAGGLGRGRICRIRWWRRGWEKRRGIMQG